MDLDLLLKSEPSDITKEEWQMLIHIGVCNGFGPSGNWFLHLLLYLLGPALDRASADWHDVGYYVGGTEVDRIRADTGFVRYMLIDIQKINGVKYLYYTILVYLFFFFVRIFGKRHFIYKKNQAL